MSANDLLFYTLVVGFGIMGARNLLYVKEFKLLKTENELLKLKLKNCEQRRT